MPEIKDFLFHYLLKKRNNGRKNILFLNKERLKQFRQHK